jgi:uncharacterized protein YjiS (DUF1127 family)
MGDAAMSTTYDATGLGEAAASTQHVFGFVKRCWDAFQERRKRQSLRATLCDLSDRELMDIGTSRGEIDYVASNRGVDPGGIRSGERTSNV